MIILSRIESPWSWVRFVSNGNEKRNSNFSDSENKECTTAKIDFFSNILTIVLDALEM